METIYIVSDMRTVPDTATGGWAVITTTTSITTSTVSIAPAATITTIITIQANVLDFKIFILIPLHFR